MSERIEVARPRKTSTLLADGRELFYFDDALPGDEPVDRTAAIDHRPLPPSNPSSSIRFDRLLDEWVAIAGHRQTRTYLPPDDECPLCPSRDGHLTEVPDADEPKYLWVSTYSGADEFERLPAWDTLDSEGRPTGGEAPE